MPEELLERIDQLADYYGYTGRSEILREASRNLFGEFEDKRPEEISTFVGKLRASKDTLAIDYRPSGVSGSARTATTAGGT